MKKFRCHYDDRAPDGIKWVREAEEYCRRFE